ncbi:hypothetical protein SRABI83_03238 [Arthrobacter sp. Bi83]|uniref:hypothetical protein n=1 Tax=Arthrobacter sp. Bi83 TaxID=2822353 RepID=UPI001DA35610|nr:hypothetical protein [Arthrobacter sp. Bi83]CAH0255709.1 hypothetical protein SRABI83_03238 [Arthrobacter sp. Bi83]
MSDEPEVTGKVAEIISDREVILNRGLKDGVRKGMYFSILDPASIGIIDPDTGEELGGIKRVKISMVAVQVADRITLASTFRTRSVNVGGNARTGLETIAGMMSAPKYVEQVERLRLDATASRPLGESESIVAKGDPFESTDQASAESSPSVTVWE